MNNILLYESFIKNRFSDNIKSDIRYKNQVSSLSQDSSILKKTEDFFQRMENRINKMADYASSLQKQRRSERGGGLDTGIESIFGLPSIVPSIFKKIFGPTQFNLKKNDEKEEEEIMKINNDFVNKDLPSISNERDLESYIESLYKKLDTKPGKNKKIDNLVKNRINLFYSNKRS